MKPTSRSLCSTHTPDTAHVWRGCSLGETTLNLLYSRQSTGFEHGYDGEKADQLLASAGRVANTWLETPLARVQLCKRFCLPLLLLNGCLQAQVQPMVGVWHTVLLTNVLPFPKLMQWVFNSLRSFLPFFLFNPPAIL